MELLSWASGLQGASVVKPWLNNSTPTLERPVNVVDGEWTKCGLEITPGPNCKTTIDQFGVLFEKFVSFMTLNIHFRNSNSDIFGQDARPVITGKQQNFGSLKAAVMERTSSGAVRVTLDNVFLVSEANRHFPLDLCISLTVNPPTSDQSNHLQQFLMPQRSHFDREERKIRALLDTHRFRPPRVPPLEAIASVVITSPLRVFSRCRELTPFSSLLTITVNNCLPYTSVRLLDLTLHTRETSKDRNRLGGSGGGSWGGGSSSGGGGGVGGAGFGSSSVFESVSISDLNDRASSSSSVAEGFEGLDSDGGSLWSLQELLTHTGVEGVRPASIAKVEADEVFTFEPVSLQQSSSTFVKKDCDDIVLEAGESYTYGYLVRVKGADVTPERGVSSARLLTALGEFCTPLTVRWNAILASSASASAPGSPGPSRLVRHHSLWSMGANYVEHSPRSFAEVIIQTESLLDISLVGPSQAFCHHTFEVRVNVTNTSNETLCDFSVVAAPTATPERQPHFVCFQASTPLRDLTPGEQASVQISVLPLRCGNLRIDNISVVSGSGRIVRPPLSLLVPVKGASMA